MISTLFYVVICALVGYYARESKLGFLGWFLLSLFISPVITFLVYHFIFKDNDE